MRTPGYSLRRPFALFVLGSAMSCGRADDVSISAAKRGVDQPFTSDVATLLDFEFDGELVTTSAANLKGQVRAQMMYTVGQLNGEGGVSHLDQLIATRITSTYKGGLYTVRYHAWMPVAWPSKINLPTSYVLTLPRRVDSTGQNTFTSRYSATCNDAEHATITISNYWYHYRPNADGCDLAAADIVVTPVSLTVDGLNRTSAYPEYQKVWEDRALNVVAVFGKYAVGATSNDDAGIATYNQFYASLRQLFPTAVVTPAQSGDSPGAANTDITLTVARDDGTFISVNMLLVEGVTVAPPSFDKRYAELTPGADLIIYNGHAGLGANVAALTRKGKWWRRRKIRVKRCASA